MNTTAAATQAGVTAATMRHWCRMGAVAARKVAGRWVIAAASLARRIALAARTAATTTKETPRMTTRIQDTDVTITEENGKIALRAPYNRDANAAYRKLSGRWDAARKAWMFDARDIERVRACVKEHIGYDDRPTATVDVRVDLDKFDNGRQPTVTVAGRVVASRRGRNDDVQLGRDTVLIEGMFAGSGGSMKYPALGDLSGIILEVRGLPADHGDLNDDGVTVLEQEAATVDTSALEAERATLMARLAEIDQLLGK